MERKYVYILLLHFDSKVQINRNIRQLYRFPIENFSHNLVVRNKPVMFGFG